MKTRQLVYAALASALSFILMWFSFPFFGAPFLKIEFSEVPVLMVGVFLSPPLGLLTQAVKDFLFLTLGGGSIWGVLSDFVCGSALMLGYAHTYRRLPALSPLKRQSAAAVVGIGLRCLVAVPLNYFILSIEFGKALTEVTSMLLPIILPFNAFKSLCNVVMFGVFVKLFQRQLEGLSVKGASHGQ